MIKKLPLYIFIFSILLFSVFTLFTKPAFSQEVSPTLTPTITPTPSEAPKVKFEDAYKTYTDAQERYDVAHEEYVLRKAQYQRFLTLESKQKAYNATLDMLQKRDSVMTAFLEAVKVRLSEAIGLSQAKIEGLSYRLDQEILWFNDHRDKLTSAVTLENLVRDSNQAKSRWLGTERLVYEVLSEVSYGFVVDFSGRSEEIFKNLKIKLEQIRTDKREGYTFSDKKFDILNRWVLEADNRLIRNKDKQVEAEGSIVRFAKSSGELAGIYNGIVNSLKEAQLFQKESMSFLKEIVKQIKTAED